MGCSDDVSNKNRYSKVPKKLWKGGAKKCVIKTPRKVYKFKQRKNRGPRKYVHKVYKPNFTKKFEVKSYKLDDYPAQLSILR